MAEQGGADEAAHFRWQEDVKREHAKRLHDREDDLINQLNLAAVTGGNIALRTAVIVNGGAGIAVLSFIGGLVGQDKVSLAQLGATTSSLLWFAAGVALGTIAMGAGYLANYTGGAAMGSRVRTWEHPYTAPGKRTVMWSRLNIAFQVFSVAAGLCSILAFVCGMFAVRGAILHVGAATVVH
jgi:hypothetical protein